MAKSRRSISELRGPLLVALASGLWGIETLFRVKLQSIYESDLLVFYEHLFGVVLVLPVFLLSGFFQRKTAISKGSWIWLCVSSLIGSALGTTFFTEALKHLNLSVANVLLNLQPVVSILLARFALGEKLGSGYFLWGTLAIMAGCVLSVETFSFENFHIENGFGLLMVLGTIICWGSSTVAGRAIMKDVPLSQAAPLRFFLGLLGTFLICLYRGHGSQVVAQASSILEPANFSAYLKLSLVSGVVPVFLYFWGLKTTPAVLGAFCEMMQTVFALVVTWVFLGYSMKFHQVIAGFILLAAIARLTYEEKKAHHLEG